MKPYKLDKEEKELLSSMEAGQWHSVKLTQGEKNRLVQAAKNTLRKNQRINIRLSQNDLEGLKLSAVREGLPYQTLIASVLHKYISGQFVQKH